MKKTRVSTSLVIRRLNIFEIEDGDNITRKANNRQFQVQLQVIPSNDS